MHTFIIISHQQINKVVVWECKNMKGGIESRGWHSKRIKMGMPFASSTFQTIIFILLVVYSNQAFYYCLGPPDIVVSNHYHFIFHSSQKIINKIQVV